MTYTLAHPYLLSDPVPTDSVLLPVADYRSSTQLTTGHSLTYLINAIGGPPKFNRGHVNMCIEYFTVLSYAFRKARPYNTTKCINA